MGEIAGTNESWGDRENSSVGRRNVFSKRWSRKVVIDIIGMLDVVAIGLASLVTMHVLDLLKISADGGDNFAIQSTLICAAVVRFMLHRGRMYAPGDLSDFPINPLRLCAAMAAGLFVVVSIFLAFGVVQDFHLSWFALWYVTGVFFLVLLRCATHLILKSWIKQGYFCSNLAVYGGGYIARRVHDHLVSKNDGVQFVGAFDDRQDESRLDTFGIKISGKLDDLIEVGRSGDIDQIIIALPQSAEGRINDIVRQLEQLPVHIHVCTHVSSNMMDAALRSNDVSAMGPVGLLKVKGKPLSDWGPLIKSAEDYILAAMMLIVSLPLFALVALAIKLTSKGPVFFLQKRHGLNHKVIRVFKFRTMRIMEDGAEVKQAEKNDDRVTAVGRLLRRTSLDELPQIINILKGEMSLVGPRPHAVVHNEEYGERLELYSNRHQVKPGITGWAQVNGFRGETRDHNLMKLRVMHDLDYITNWSLWFDLKIIFMTPIFGLVNRNAY